MNKSFASALSSHITLGLSLRVFLWTVPMLMFAALYLFIKGWDIPSYSETTISVLAALAWWVIISGIRVAAEWEWGVIFFNGRFRRVQAAGIFYVIPFLEIVIFVDQRLLTINIPSQQAITRDNVPAAVEGVLFFKVSDPRLAVVGIQNFRFAIAQYAQAALRDVIGNLLLDELLSERERIQHQIAEIISQHVNQWGLKLDSVRLQDIELPEDLKKIMSRQATAEREKRATITKAEGDRIAADNLAKAAAIMQNTVGAMQLRTLQTIDSLGSSNSNTVILFPVEIQSEIKKIVERLPVQKLIESAGQSR